VTISSDSKLKREDSRGEIKLMKDSIKKSNDEAKDSARALKEVNKLAKTKEKEIYNLHQRFNNSLVTLKKLKRNKFELKRETNTANKAVKSLEKRPLQSLKIRDPIKNPRGEP
jgi:hypothetical protein